MLPNVVDNEKVMHKHREIEEIVNPSTLSTPYINNDVAKKISIAYFIIIRNPIHNVKLPEYVRHNPMSRDPRCL